MNLVSVLMPVYNVEKYIEEAVNSVLNQTYTNIELIIVDDCSKDNTYKILQDMEKRDHRIKLYKNIENKKIVETLNFAFEKSSGDYICRMDGDDISDSRRIENKMLYLQENQDISLVGCSVYTIDERGNNLRKREMLSNQKTIIKTLKYSTPVFHIWLARREVYEKLHGYRNIPYVEDYDFLLRMTTLGLKYSNISNYFGYSIRLHSNNTISNVGIIQRKAHRYCYQLYLQRKKNKCDSFTINDFYKYVKSSDWEKKIFNLSNIFLQRALSNNKRFNLKKIMYFFVSYLLSFEQRRYINGRIMALLYYKNILGR